MTLKQSYPFPQPNRNQAIMELLIYSMNSEIATMNEQVKITNSPKSSSQIQFPQNTAMAITSRHSLQKFKRITTQSTAAHLIQAQ